MITRRFLLVCGAVVVALGQGPAALMAQAQDRLKFEIYQDDAKEFRWRLKAGNGEILSTAGQGYKAKADCLKGVERIKTEADKLALEVYEDNAKLFRWQYKAANGQVVATSSQGYRAKADCEKAVALIKQGAAKAEVVDMS